MKQTTLDDALFRLLGAHPEWLSHLAPSDVDLVMRRWRGASFRELGELAGLTPSGVRVRLYGRGHGRVRSGGVLGKLRGLARRS